MLVNSSFRILSPGTERYKGLPVLETPGSDWGPDGLVQLARLGRHLVIFTPGHSVWAGLGRGQRYTPAQYGLGVVESIIGPHSERVRIVFEVEPSKDYAWWRRRLMKTIKLLHEAGPDPLDATMVGADEIACLNQAKRSLSLYD